MRIARRFRSVLGGVKLAGRPYQAGGLVGSDLTCQYQVIPPVPVSQDGVAQFNIRNSAAQSLDGAYSTRAYVGQSLSAQFSTLGTAVPVYRTARRMRATGTLRKIVVATSLPARPTAALTAVFNIGGTVTRDITTTYQVAPTGPGETWMLGDPFDVFVSSIAASGSVAITNTALSAVNRDQVCTYNLFGALGSINAAGVASVAKVNASGSVLLSSDQLTASADLVAQYGVVQQAFATLTGSWSVLQPVQADSVGRYSLTGLEPVSEDLVGEYQMASVVNKNLTAAYQVLMTVARPASFSYAVLSPNAVSADLGGAYSVGGWVQHDAVFAWESGGWVRSDLLVSWRVGDLSASPARFTSIDLSAAMTAASSPAQQRAAHVAAGFAAYRA